MSFLLLQSGDHLLLQSGDKLLLQDIPKECGSLLLQSGFKLLLQNGKSLGLECDFIPCPPSGDDALLLQSGFYLRLQSGCRLLLQRNAPPVPPTPGAVWGGVGARGHYTRGDHLLYQQELQRQQIEAEHQRRALEDLDEEDLKLILSIWLNLK